jgi:hypothetical protein
MVSFKEYLLEYKTKQNAMISGIAGIKDGINGKSFDRAHLRKHTNTVAKGYKPRHTIPNGIISGAGLSKLLSDYNLIFEPGVKHLGNSKSTIEMYINSEDEECARVRKAPNE